MNLFNNLGIQRFFLVVVTVVVMVVLAATLHTRTKLAITPSRYGPMQRTFPQHDQDVHHEVISARQCWVFEHVGTSEKGE
jgi:hypothetical protein